MPGTITTDFTTVNNADAITSWTFTPAWSTTPVADTDMWVQGTACVAGRVSALIAWAVAPNYTAGVDLTTGPHIFIWAKCITWPSAATRVSGGLRIGVTSDTTPTLTTNNISNGKTWYVDGSDFGSTEGWTCYVVDPLSQPDIVNGTYAITTSHCFGTGFDITGTVGAGSFKPHNCAVDLVKFGTGLTINNGTSSAPVGFIDIYTADSNSSNAYGVLTSVNGVYFGAGKMNFGTTGQSAVTYFQDEGQILIYQPFLVSNSFYEIKLAGAASFNTTFQLGKYVNSVVSGGCTVSGTADVGIGAPGSAPSGSATTGTNLGIGSYQYQVTFVTSLGETSGAESSAITTTSGNQAISLTSIPTYSSTSRVIARNLYRTKVGGAAGTEQFVTTIGDNTTTTFTDALPDSLLGRAVPAGDTTVSSAWTLTASASNTVTNLYGCTLVNMRRGAINSSGVMRSCVISGSGALSTNGATLDNCTFSDALTQPPIAANWSLKIASSTEMSSVTNCNIINCNKGIRLAGAGTYTFSNIKFSSNVYDVENAVSVCDYYSELNVDGKTSMLSGSIVGVAQSFTGNGNKIMVGQFYLKKTGAPTGTATAKIYAHSGTFGTSSIPTGAALATSQTVDVSTLLTAYQLISFRFLGTNNITLTNGTNYVMSVEFSGGSAGNTVDVGTDTSGTYATGNGSTLTGSTWTATSYLDVPFYVFTPIASDNYNETNQDTTQSMRSASVVGVGQSFVGNGGVLTSAQFYLKKTGSPTGTAVAKVYAHSGTFGTSSIPTGAALATSGTIDVSTLTTSYALTSFKFTGTNNITLTNATDYVVTVEYSGGSSGNTVDVGIDSSAPTHGGNESTLTGSTWTAASGIDAVFFVFTDGEITINVTNGGSTPTYINNIGCSTTVNNAVTLKVVVKDILGSPIQNARVAIYASSDINQSDYIVNALTDATGTVSSSYAYIFDLPIDIRVRHSSTGTTRYFNNDSSGTIISTGFSTTITLIKDTIASP